MQKLVHHYFVWIPFQKSHEIFWTQKYRKRDWFLKEKNKIHKRKNRKTKAAMHKLSWKILAKSLNIIFAKFKIFKNGHSTFCVIFQFFFSKFP